MIILLLAVLHFILYFYVGAALLAIIAIIATGCLFVWLAGSVTIYTGYVLGCMILYSLIITSVSWLSIRD